jgi:hypothetical protein
VAFARHEFWLDSEEAGTTRRKALTQVQKQLKRPPPGLVNPHELPWAAKHVWAWFGELHATRTWNFSSPNAFAWSELDAWARLSGNAPRLWELRLLREIDRAYLQVYAEEQDKKPRFKKREG